METENSGATDTPREPATAADRRTLVRDAAVLQVKLVIDGLRDLLLVPASIVAAIMSVIDHKNGRPGTQFYDLLAMGKRSEHWIDLFGALRDRDEYDLSKEGNIDQVIDRMEAYVVDEYRRGSITKQAKERIDQALGALQERKARGK